MNAEALSGIIGAIYDAAADPARWPVALRALVEGFQGSGASLITRDMATMEGRWVSTHDPASEREYFEVWRYNNVFANRARGGRPKLVETDRDILPKAELLGSDYYNAFLRPRGLDGVMLIWLKRDGAVQSSLSLSRHRRAGEFDSADVELGRLLSPHLDRAVVFAERLRCTNLRSANAADALDALRCAIVLLDEEGRALHLNRGAERLVADADGLTIARGRLHAAKPTLDRRLEAVLAGAAGRDGSVATAGAMPLPRPSGKPALLVLAVPLRGGLDWLGPHRRSVCVCVVDPAETPAALPARLAALFGLTAAEARVACELLAGGDSADIADRLAISRHTVRAHLARTMAKTETRRQGELIRLLTQLSPLPD